MPLDLKFLLHVVVASNLPLEGHVRKYVSSPLKILEVQLIASSNFFACVYFSTLQNNFLISVSEKIHH